jgi:hypothetical protein
MEGWTVDMGQKTEPLRQIRADQVAALVQVKGIPFRTTPKTIAWEGLAHFSPEIPERPNDSVERRTGFLLM